MTPPAIDPELLQTLWRITSNVGLRPLSMGELELIFKQARDFVTRGRLYLYPDDAAYHRATRYLRNKRSLFKNLGNADGWGPTDRAAVLSHLRLLESMGLLTRLPSSGVHAQEARWASSTAEEFARHVEASPMREVIRQSQDDVLLDRPVHDGPLQASVISGDGDGGGQGGGGGDGGGGRNANASGAGNGDGGGIGEVLAHPVLFALPEEDFDRLVGQLFTGPGAP